MRTPTMRQPEPFGRASEGDGMELINIDRVLSAARRQWKWVAICGVIGLLLAVAYVATAVPQYTASSNLLIDAGGGTRLLNELSSASTSIEDETAILSQVEILRSRKISSAVVDRLDLTNNPVFMTPEQSVFGRLRSLLRQTFDVSAWLGSDDPPPAADSRKRSAVEALLRNVGISRVGLSSVLSIQYTSPDRDLSAKIADAFAEAYLTDQLDAKYEATRRASGWLQDRIEELRQQSLRSDQAVQTFRAENNLIAAGGQLVSDQQLEALNNQLITAQNEVNAAKARYDRTKALIDSGDTNAVVTDSLGSQLVTSIRTKYLDALRRENDISSRLGPLHQQAVRLRAEMDEYRRQMFSELTRLADTYQGEYEVAQAREASLRESVAKATGVSSNANNLQVQLRELEREADTYRNLYQTFLQRYQEAIQQQSFPVTTARVITNAQPPLKPSQPRKLLVLALGAFLGCAGGAGIGAAREFRDRFFRTADQVSENLGLECLGLITRVPNQRTQKRSPAELEAMEAQRLIRRSSSVSRYVLDHPLSSFAETLRSVKIAADLTIEEPRGKIIGVVSVLPGEGKSTVSANLASLLALQGARTLLIDCDLRNPGLTRAVAAHAKNGLVEAILQERPVADVVYTDPDTGLAVIPAVLKQRIPHTSELLTSNSMTALLNEASRHYDYILLDLPPINPVVDVRAMAHRVDGFVFVVEWGNTARRVVRSALNANPRIAERCLGVVLNKVDSEKMKFYREFGSTEYYNARYASYYTDAAS
ncbi:polysaccharide biosynthesis tyrosine autokinase [Aureimonas sp. AU4]|uniref:polysaccharide biosynthesis tyrosine autokinase n=1 Tax=Aureimonas sp. AU4 TaxID=1638163 RepID=UPI0035B5CA86